MKSKPPPPVRIEPESRRELEQVHEDGEVLCTLDEKAVQGEAADRREHAEFTRRGLVAVKRTVEAGDGIPADIVMSKLRAKVSEAPRRRARLA